MIDSKFIQITSRAGKVLLLISLKRREVEKKDSLVFWLMSAMEVGKQAHKRNSENVQGSA